MYGSIQNHSTQRTQIRRVCSNNNGLFNRTNKLRLNVLAHDFYLNSSKYQIDNHHRPRK